MKPFKKTLFVFFALLYLPTSAGAISMSWSGFGRLEAFYQDESNHYADFLFTFQPQLHIRDDLSFQVRFDLLGLEKASPWEQALEHSGLLHQRGYVFLYKDFNDFSQSIFPFILPTQFYLDYKSEFFKVRVGRAPYHFGLGASYSATENPFDLWMSVPDQISVYMHYESFYIQPSFFYHGLSSEKSASALLQGGMDQENWKVALLYEYSFEKSTGAFAELYGEYEEKNWNLKSSLSYLFRFKNSFALAFEGLYNWPAQIPLVFGLKGGALNKEAQFHPQYHPSLFLQNRWMREGLSIKEGYQMATAQIQNSLYLAPSLSLSFFEESLKLSPLLLFSYSFAENQSSYELNISGNYSPQESLFFNIETGILYQKEWSFGLLAQAAVSF